MGRRITGWTQLSVVSFFAHSTDTHTHTSWPGSHKTRAKAIQHLADLVVSFPISARGTAVGLFSQCKFADSNDQMFVPGPLVQMMLPRAPCGRCAAWPINETTDKRVVSFPRFPTVVPKHLCCVCGEQSETWHSEAKTRYRNFEPF